jgi:hypothetical protein
MNLNRLPAVLTNPIQIAVDSALGVSIFRPSRALGNLRASLFLLLR